MGRQTQDEMLLCPHALFVVQGGKGHTVVCGSQRSWHCPSWVIRDRGGRSHTTVHVRFTPESGHPIFHAALGWRDQTATRYDLRNTDVRWRTHSSAGKLLSSGLQSVAEFDCDLQAV